MSLVYTSHVYFDNYYAYDVYEINRFTSTGEIQ